jgi:glycosyltransferase involved in cell wall biosynthesis
VVIAGDGPLMSEMRSRVDASAWARGHVRLLGIVADTPAFLAAIDVLVLTSDTEGLPNAVIEAMAAGVPCIATRVSDVPDLVTDNGFVVAPGDVEGLAGALGRMRRMEAEERRELGRRGALRAEAEFDLPAAAARFWNAHDEALRARSSTGPA